MFEDGGSWESCETTYGLLVEPWDLNLNCLKYGDSRHQSPGDSKNGWLRLGLIVSCWWISASVGSRDYWNDGNWTGVAFHFSGWWMMILQPVIWWSGISWEKLGRVGCLEWLGWTDVNWLLDVAWNYRHDMDAWSYSNKLLPLCMGYTFNRKRTLYRFVEALQLVITTCMNNK